MCPLTTCPIIASVHCQLVQQSASSHFRKPRELLNLGSFIILMSADAFSTDSGLPFDRCMLRQWNTNSGVEYSTSINYAKYLVKIFPTNVPLDWLLYSLVPHRQQKNEIQKLRRELVSRNSQIIKASLVTPCKVGSETYRLDVERYHFTRRFRKLVRWAQITNHGWSTLTNAFRNGVANKHRIEADVGEDLHDVRE